MTILRSLRQVAHKTSYKTKRPFLFISTTTPTTTTSLRRTPTICSHGPLFLSYPPWKLLQSATPLYDVLSIPKLPPAPAPAPRVVDNINSDGKLLGHPNGLLLLQSFLNWPNFISMSRLLSGPVLGWMIINDMYLPAFIGLVVSGATDWLDGYVARKMGINSVVGSYLDPLADKVLIGSVALAMLETGLLHSGLVALVVIRDLALVGGAVYVRATHLGSKSKSWSEFFNLDGVRPQKVEPLMISKLNTCLQLALVTGALLQPEFGTQETESYITYLSWLVAATTVGSTAAYGTQHLKNRSIFVKKKS